MSSDSKPANGLNTRSPSLLPKSIVCTIDVLTAGSEHAGSACLFLSLYKRGVADKGNGDDENHYRGELDCALKCRYAMTGLGDVLCRAAADQRFKLHSTRAVFAQDTISLQGLPGLLAVLNQAGCPKLTVVSSVTDRVDIIVNKMLQHKSHPMVQLCQVPTVSNACETCDGKWPPRSIVEWWKVYEDENIVVHASSSFAPWIAYHYTMQHMSQTNHSFVVLPEPYTPMACEAILSCLPVAGESEPLRLFAVVLVGINLCCMGWTALTEKHADLAWYFVDSQQTAADPGLLVRAQWQSMTLSRLMPSYFPWNDVKFSMHSLKLDEIISNEPSSFSSLSTGCSLMVYTSRRACSVSTSILDRRPQTSTEKRDEFIINQQRWLETLNRFMTITYPAPRDENEIDLDDGLNEEISCVHDPTTIPLPYLLVLGTGCAAPSPYRGASGYALCLDELTIVFEVGEGFVTQWSRYGAGRALDSIRFIWISHAHWDHYGGIVNLLVSLQRIRFSQQGDKEDAKSKPKRARRLDATIPIVVAPRKVLQYISQVLVPSFDFFHGIEQNHKTQSSWNILRQRLLTDERLGPILLWEDVLVDHSCRDAYGFVLAFRSNDGQIRTMCYSGDTRPCQRLADASQRASSRLNERNIDFLIHEATFDESDKEMGLQKKHSTISEAINVATLIDARRTLLTHFSQRYSGYSERHAATGRIGFAVDGMLIPL